MDQCRASLLHKQHLRSGRLTLGGRSGVPYTVFLWINVPCHAPAPGKGVQGTRGVHWAAPRGGGTGRGGTRSCSPDFVRPTLTVPYTVQAALELHGPWSHRRGSTAIRRLRRVSYSHSPASSGLQRACLIAREAWSSLTEPNTPA